MKSEWIEVGGHRLEAARWGRGPGAPILLLHEGLGSIALWKDFPAALAGASGREVIAWSRQGHGWSAPYDGTRQTDYMHREADLLPEVHRALGIGRAHWLGHSDGGSIALLAAARFPELVASLTLEAPHVFVEDLTVASIADVARQFPLGDMGERMKRYHADPRALFGDWSRIWLAPEFRNWDITASLADVVAPSLLVQGRDDRYGTPRQLDAIAAGVPVEARLEPDNCGHSPHFDARDAVLTGIAKFLDGKD